MQPYTTRTTHKINSVCWSPDGQFLASGGDDKTVQFFLLQFLNKPTLEWKLQRHDAIVWSVAYSCDGRWLASGSFDQSVQIWDVQSGECVRVLKGHTSPISTIMFHPWQLLIATAGSEVKIWSLETGQCQQTLNDHHSLVVGMAFAPDGTTLVAGGDNGTLQRWDLATAQCIHVLQLGAVV
jgi:WD40 repeat protein